MVEENIKLLLIPLMEVRVVVVLADTEIPLKELQTLVTAALI